ncbi:putative drug resistance transporter [Gordonia effusa NBRC 100432]|uniref:Putative drug resistance transporter n=1 Tax=Gordonia effusa NBRC 100432 TaxID=1077974 RepID=H0R1D5_9ACTN|nr:MFS transporter [Gordonia effusa]GAB18886.1 putative drug resistance transporter [Gordonia effusa NBRC 100432]
MVVESPAAPTTGGTRRAWFGLAVLVLPVLLVSMDVSVLFLAMPTLTHELHPTATQSLWILDIYGFLLAGLLITMGNLGDRIGRRLLLLIGATIFGAGSVVAALSVDPTMLIAARALMGIGGATLLPSSLSLISTMFPDAGARARAIGVWTAAFAGGAAVGPIVGGVLLQHFWWGSVFLINLPVLAILLLAGPFLLPEHRAGATGGFDVVGVALSLAGILPTVYAIKHAAVDGVDATAVITGVIGVAMLALFVAYEQRVDNPLLDLELLSNKRFAVAIGSSLVGMMSLAALGYLTSIYLQTVTGRDPLDAAILGIPMAVTVFVFSLSAARITEKLGARTGFIVALGAAALGNFALLGIGVDGGVWAYLVGSAIAGVGYGIAFSLVSDVAVSSVSPERAGAATGLSETSFELGNALGLALLGSLASLVFQHGVSPSGQRFDGTLDQVVSAATDPATITAAQQSFVNGVHIATGLAGILLAMMAVIVAWILPREKKQAR